MKEEKFRCPNCGANLSGDDMYTCEYCQTILSENRTSRVDDKDSNSSQTTTDTEKSFFWNISTDEGIGFSWTKTTRNNNKSMQHRTTNKGDVEEIFEKYRQFHNDLLKENMSNVEHRVEEQGPDFYRSLTSRDDLIQHHSSSVRNVNQIDVKKISKWIMIFLGLVLALIYCIKMLN